MGRSPVSTLAGDTAACSSCETCKTPTRCLAIEATCRQRQTHWRCRSASFHDRLSCGCVRLKTEKTLARLGLFFLSFFLFLQPACGCLIPATRLVRCFAAATAPGVCGCTLLSATSLCTDQPLAVALFLMRDDATRNKERRGALGSSMADPQTFNSRLKGVFFGVVRTILNKMTLLC